MDIKIVILIVVSTMIPILSAQFSCSKVEVNVDYKGDDISYFFTDTQAACCDACLKDLRCGIWTYVLPYKACFIKYGNKTIRIGSQDRKLIYF
jgi:hypothetical protein